MVLLVCRIRIIPALAGNTTVLKKLLKILTDHPRSRGEYWGDNPYPRHVWWIIPALAGNTVAAIAYYPRSEDHPRSRGEYLEPRR